MLGLAVVSTSAQTPDLRKVAATGPDYPGLEEQPVWETRIAAGSNRIITVYVAPRSAAPTGASRIGYAIARQTGGIWVWNTQGLVTPAAQDTPWAMDPDIAYDATADDFLACCVHGVYDTDLTAVAIARYSGSSTPFGAGWQVLTDTVDADYPKIVAGRELSTPQGPKRELWITYHKYGGGMFYKRSTDGGATWSGGEIPVINGTTSVSGRFGHPAVGADGSLFIAYFEDNTFLTKFLRGTVSGSSVTFEHLKNGSNEVVVLTPVSSFLNAHTPVNSAQFNNYLWTQANLATDPADPNVVHMVYNDLVQAPNGGEVDRDVDVFYRHLTNTGSGAWTLGSRERVNTDVVNTEDIKDQFRPYVIATPKSGDASRLHVIFYDDRNYTQNDQEQQQSAPPRMDLFYAYSLDGGAHWTNVQVLLTMSTPDPPALDYSVPLTSPRLTGFQRGEYNGISVRSVQDDWEIWASFVQMLPANPPAETETDYSQIGAVRVPFSQ